MKNQVATFALVGLGGACGAALRHAVGLGVARLTVATGPLGALGLGTLTVNLVGCFAIGALVGHLDGRGAEQVSLRLFAVTGLLGGFTTYSTFALDTLKMFDAGQGGRLAIYVGLHLTLGMIAVWAGHRLGG